MTKTRSFASVLVAGAFSVIALSSVSTASAVPIPYYAVLDGPSEPTVSPGTGWALVTYDSTLHSLSVHVAFQDLLAGVTASHIHCCTALPGVGTAGVATPTPTFPGFPSGVTSGTYDRVFDLTLSSSFNAAFITGHGGTTASAEAALASGLAAGDAYLNIHTTAFPGGEIRGFLVVPEPESIALFGVGLCGLLASRRRRLLPA